MDVLTLNSDDLIAAAERDFEQSLGGMRVRKLIGWEKAGLTEPEELNAGFLKSLSHDERRFVFDQIHDIAMLPVYAKNRPHERAEALAGIDTDVLDAKWRYMLSLANGAYDLGLDYVDLEILTPLYRQLATIERGATNVRMPTTHKLRHNPSIHSLHVAGLIHEIFGGAQAGQPEALQNEIRSFAKGLMRSALVHDMGELEGELSIAEDRAKMSVDEVKQFEAARGHSEAEVFTNALDSRRKELKRLRWPEALLEDKCDDWQQAYERGEAADTFAGRVHKCLERMQSQQDYLRFDGKDMAPRLSARLQGYEDYRTFFREYALEPFEGQSKGNKVSTSLEELAGEEATALSRTVFKAVDSSLKKLQGDIKAALKDDTPEETRFTERVRAREAARENMSLSR